MKKYMIRLIRLLLGCEQAPGSGYLSSVRRSFELFANWEIRLEDQAPVVQSGGLDNSLSIV